MTDAELADAIEKMRLDSMRLEDLWARNYWARKLEQLMKNNAKQIVKALRSVPAEGKENG